jgi:hypothetical protein
MDLVVRLLDVVEGVVEQHQHVVVLFTESRRVRIAADLDWCVT